MKLSSLAMLLGVATMVAAAAGPMSSVSQAEGGRPHPPDDPAGKPVDAGEAVQQFLSEKFQEAKDLFKRKQYYPAFRLADAILVIDPDVPFRAELRRLRRRAKARYLGSSVLTATFEFDATASFPCQSLAGTLVLENVSRKPVQVGEKRRAGILGRAVFHVTDVYPDGSEVSSSGTRVLRLEKGLELGPGESRRIPLEIDFPRPAGMPVLQLVEVTGSVRPPKLLLEGREVALQVPWQNTRKVLLHEELADVEANPYEHLQLALLSRDLARLVVSARLYRLRLEEDDPRVAALRRERTIDLLLTSLQKEDDASLHGQVIRELGHLTGKRRKPTVESWLKFARERERKRARWKKSADGGAPADSGQGTSIQMGDDHAWLPSACMTCT